MEAGSAPAAAEAQAPEAAEVQAPEVDLATFDSRLNEANDAIRQLGETNQAILSRLPEPTPEPAPDFEAQFNELFQNSAGYPDPGELQQLNQQQIQHGIQEAIAPYVQQMQAFQQQMTAQELSALQQQFPELSDQKAADALADAVVSTATSLLPQGAPPEIADGLMQNANFVRLVHLAEKAKSRSQQETPAGQGQPVPQIETGGGAAPGSTSEGDEWAKIANAGRGSQPIW